jgi:UTP--glucose-1-phosphate uridylyltransferase
MHANVRKVVFPAAGLGTRFLPATKAMPKEMLCVVDKPIIQYGVEEAVASGIENVIMVTGRDKSPMEDHFDISYELEAVLASRNKTALLAAARAVGDIANIAYIRQKEALGLGHAVLRAAELVGPEPFAVILPDDVIYSKTPCIRQLIDVYEQYHAPVIAVMEVPNDKISSYGCVAVEQVSETVYRVTDMVEKPKASEAPSNLAIIGRYVLTPDIFDALRKTAPGAGAEIQLTDGIRHLMKSRTIYALKFEGTRYDAGDKFGFLKATVEFGLRHETLGEDFRAYLKDLQL